MRHTLRCYWLAITPLPQADYAATDAINFRHCARAVTLLRHAAIIAAAIIAATLADRYTLATLKDNIGHAMATQDID